MARDGDLPTIFHPNRTSKRVRAPSVIVTLTTEDGQESERGSIRENEGEDRRERRDHAKEPSLQTQTSDPLAPLSGSQHGYTESGCVASASSQDEERQALRCSSCSYLAKKIYYGICVTVLLTLSWVMAIHSIKYLYLEQYIPSGYGSVFSTDTSAIAYRNYTLKARKHNLYNAPFFTAWFCTNWLVFFYPIYIVIMLISNKCQSANDIVTDAFRDFKEKGFTFARFVSRCGLFCLLWVITTYMYMYSLKILLATDVVALFATNVSCIYLLSWVILHEQFVGVRIVAAILCDTGIALLAYMDGITGSSTLGGVVLAAFAAASFAIFKVLFRKVMGEVKCGQRALFFSLVGSINASLLWPICLALYLTGSEMLPSHRMPWIPLLVAALSLLLFHLIYQFGSIVTYNMFVTLGLITAVPVSAALDVLLYEAQFEGMKLAGVILIGVGFFLVMFPDNWPDYIMRLLRWSRRRRGGTGGIGGSGAGGREGTDYRTGYIRSHLRSPSGRVR